MVASRGRVLSSWYRDSLGCPARGFQLRAQLSRQGFNDGVLQLVFLQESQHLNRGLRLPRRQCRLEHQPRVPRLALHMPILKRETQRRLWIVLQLQCKSRLLAAEERAAA